jgi:hypothetical protein
MILTRRHTLSVELLMSLLLFQLVSYRFLVNSESLLTRDPSQTSTAGNEERRRNCRTQGPSESWMNLLQPF